MLPPETKRNDLVTVPFEYLLSTHVQMNATYDKLKEIIGESATLALFALAADENLPSKRPTAPSSVEELRKILDESGYELNAEVIGDNVDFRLSCPHAARIHPHLGTDPSFCPMSQMVLSTMRKKFGKSVVVESKLVRGGSQFIIKVQASGDDS